MQLFVRWENRFLPTDTEHVFFFSQLQGHWWWNRWSDCLLWARAHSWQLLFRDLQSWVGYDSGAHFRLALFSFFNPHLTTTLIILQVVKWNIVDRAPCGTFAALPREILMYIFRWVVSSDLDLRALEQLSLVCRGFYICARSAPPLCESRSLLCAHSVTLRSCISRDPEIWHSACARVWGRNCTKVVPFKSWRDMFLRRPRVRFDGKRIF